MSADVIVVLSTTANTGAVVDGAGWAGVGVGVAAAVGFDVVGDEVGDAGRPEPRRRGCAMTLTAIVITRTKTQREVRFINCIFLMVARVVNLAQKFGVRRQSGAATALWIFNDLRRQQIQSGVTLYMPPHSKFCAREVLRCGETVKRSRYMEGAAKD